MDVKEFSGADFDLTLGEVYGLRTWRMDRSGRLRALHLTKVPAWRPGENVATCQAKASDPYSWFMNTGLTFTINSTGTAAASSESKEPEKHDVPVESCRCGFYGYTDPQHEELKTTDDKLPLVLGVIRGTGRTLVGTKGFRCEKAEIVALLDPTRGGLLPHPDRFRRRHQLRDLYPGVPLFRSRRALFDAFPVEQAQITPSDDAFWSAP